SAETGTTSPATVPDMPESSGPKVRITPQMLETMADHGLRFPSELAESATVSYVGRTSEELRTKVKQSNAVTEAEGSDATIGGGVYFGKVWKSLNIALLGGAHAEVSYGSSNDGFYTIIDVEQNRTAISSTQVYRVERGGSHNDSHLVTVPVHIARRLGWPLPEKFHQEFKLDIPESERAFSYPNGAGDEVVDIPGKEQIIKIAAKGLSPQGKEAVRRALATPGLAKWAYLNASRGWGFTVDWTEGHGRHTRDHTVRVKIRTLPPTSYRESGQQKSRDEDKGIMYLRAYNAVTRKLKVGAGIVFRRLKNPSGTTSRNAPTIGGEINVDFSAIGKHGAARKDGRVAWKADMVDVEVDIDVTAIHTSSIAPNRW